MTTRSGDLVLAAFFGVLTVAVEAAGAPTLELLACAGLCALYTTLAITGKP